jgi:hypothetical protein
VEGAPTLVFYEGRLKPALMRHRQVTESAVYQAIREHKPSDLEEMHAVILEIDGAFSVIAGGQRRTKAPSMRPDAASERRLHAAKRALARRFTAPAGLGPDAAMLVLVRVSLPLVTTDAARGNTRIEHLSNDLFVGSRSTVADGRKGLAHVCAVEVESNALSKLSNHVFSKACIGARGARLRTGVRRLDRVNQRLIHVAAHIGVSRSSRWSALNGSV